MPIVKVEMMSGTAIGEKEKLIKGITKAFEDIGMQKDWVQIVINENPPENWGIRGELGSKVVKK